MKMYRTAAVAVAFSLALSGSNAALFAVGETATIGGTVKDEAKKGDNKDTPYAGYSVQAREVSQGIVGGTAPISPEGAYTLPDMSMARYLVELLYTDKDGLTRVVCTEGPFDFTAPDPNKIKDVNDEDMTYLKTHPQSTRNTGDDSLARDPKGDLLKNNVIIDCGHVPVAWWLLGAAAGAGITAGVLANDSSPSR